MNARHQALAHGTWLGGYEIDRVLGTGAFGVTYLAHDRDLERAVAIKEYFPTTLATRDSDGVTVVARSDETAEAYQYGLVRFVDEARTLARFQNPNIVRVNHFEQANGTAYLVMEYAHGDTLARLLKHGPLDPAAVIPTLCAIMNGLAVVHAHDILHRDVKPANIVMHPDRGPVLLDFGAARVALLGRTENITVMLTPGYAPLEQYGEGDELGPWTDIYAVGATLYDCLLGEPPEEATRRLNALHYGTGDPVVKALAVKADGGNALAVELIEWMMQPDIRDRPQSCEAVLVEATASEDAPTQARGVSPDHATVVREVGAPMQSVAPTAARWTPAPGELERARAFLADRMGPIARILVERAAAAAPDRDRFVEQIATEMETESERQAWRRMFRGA